MNRLFDDGSSLPRDRADDIACGDWVTNPVTRALVEAGDDWILVDDDDRPGVESDHVAGYQGPALGDFFNR